MAAILILADRSDIRQSLVLLFEEHGYQVFEADCCESVEQTLNQHDIALLVIDINIGFDNTATKAFSLLTWLNNSSINIPSLVLTSRSNRDLGVQSLEYGVGMLIEKPWRNKHLLHSVRQLLSLDLLNKENTQLKQQLDQNVLSSKEKNSSSKQKIPLMTLEQAEIDLVKLAMEKSEKNVPKAAVLLGLTKASMYRRLEKYGLNKT